MAKKESRAHDNVYKIDSRRQISEKINNLFDKDSEINIVELLGSGVGYEYYRESLISSNKTFFLVEREKNLAKEAVLKYENNNDNKIIPYDVYYFFSESDEESYDVINLDLCSFFTETEYKNNNHSSVDLIRKMFSSKCLKKNGVFFVTFMLLGHMIQVHKNKKEIILSSDIIKNRIIDIAKEYGHDLEEIHFFDYKSISDEKRKGILSHMMNVGFTIR